MRKHIALKTFISVLLCFTVISSFTSAAVKGHNGEESHFHNRSNTHLTESFSMNSETDYVKKFDSSFFSESINTTDNKRYFGIEGLAGTAERPDSDETISSAQKALLSSAKAVPISSVSRNIIAKGVDLSSWQKNVDYKALVNAGYTFAILRASFGWESGQKDNMFETHIYYLQALGIPCGAYHYSYATTVEEAEKEAYYFLSCIKGHKFEMPVYFDMEDNSQAYLSKSLSTKIANRFCEILQDAGYMVGIYTNPSWMQSHYYTSELFPKYELWLAQWSSSVPSSSIEYGIWQYGGETNYIESPYASGVSGPVDKNYLFKNYPEIIKSGNYNGYDSGVKLGDLNRDGILSMSDVILFQRILAGIVAINDYYKVAADMNMDSVISTFDLTILQRQIAESESS